MTKQKMTLASFIASQREKLGNISQVELAKKCNVPAGTIASIESGYAKSPRPVTLKKLADGLCVPTEIIFKLASNPEKEMTINYDSLSVFRLPYVGTIPTKEKLKFEDEEESAMALPVELVDEGDFILTISGNELATEDIYDGDYIIVLKQDFLMRSGDFMLCTIDKETSLRRVYKGENEFKINDKAFTKDQIIFLGKAIMSISRRKL